MKKILLLIVSIFLLVGCTSNVKNEKEAINVLNNGYYECNLADGVNLEFEISDSKFKANNVYINEEIDKSKEISGDIIEMDDALYYFAIDENNKESYSRYYFPLILRIIDNDVYYIDLNSFYYYVEGTQYYMIPDPYWIPWDESIIPTSSRLLQWNNTEEMNKCTLKTER